MLPRQAEIFFRRLTDQSNMGLLIFTTLIRSLLALTSLHCALCEAAASADLQHVMNPKGSVAGGERGQEG